MNNEKIGYLEAISIVTLVIMNKVILILPQEIISLAGSSAWLNALYVSIIAIFFAWLISSLFKNFQGFDILDVSEFLGGNKLKIIIGLLYVFLLLIVPIFVLKNFTETLKVIYFRNSPFIYTVLFFVISIIIANHFSTKVLSKANLILMFLGFLGIALVLILSVKNFSTDQVFPILGYGFKETFITGLSSLFSFSGIGYLFLLSPLLDKPNKLKKISILSISISGLYLFFTILCIVLSFSFSFKSEESISLYLLARTIDFGRFIQRIDAIFIFIWIITSLFYVSFAIHFAIYLLKKITKVSNSIFFNYGINLLVLAIVIIPVGLAMFNNIIEPIFKVLVFGLLFITSTFILILANFKFRFLKKKNKIC